MPSPSDSNQLNTETTELAENKIQHDEAMDSLGIIVGEIAHDFNNILSLIFGYVEMALSEIPPGERARSDLEHVLAAGDRAKDLVARILTYSKSTKLKRAEITIDKPIRDALTYISERLPINIKLDSSIDSSRGNFVLSNETEIYQIINNLCTNSLQAMPDSGGEIEVTLDYIDANDESIQELSNLIKRDYARITVSDDGCGMDISTIENMYTPFFTTARGLDSDESRAGLGLTTVYNIVSSQGGVIHLESIPDKGTSFQIFLPLISNKNHSLDSPLTNEDLQTKNILFIDDDPSIIDMASQVLEKNNYTVTSFIDGNEAIEYFRQQPHHFDLVITDLIMPSITGTELSSKMSMINPNIPIILTTGFSEKITSATCRQWGITTVINKPFALRDFLGAIEKLI